MRNILLIVLILSFVNLVYASEIDFDYPSEIKVWEEFEVELSLLEFDEEIYDVKFELLDGSNNLLKIHYGGRWNSGFFFINDAVNGSENRSSQFKLRVNEGNGIYSLNIKIRDSKKSVWKFGDFIVNISGEDEGFNEGEGVDEKDEIRIDLDWNVSEIINGEDFYVRVEISEFDGDEIKLWIEDKGNVISDRYDGGWKSGKFYLSEFGNEGEVGLRIREEYGDFVGDAKILLKLRNGFVYSEDIEILERVDFDGVERNISGGEKVVESTRDIEVTRITGETIRLGFDGREDIKTSQSNYYESGTEIVKRYSVYFFALLCVVIGILIGWRKLE